MSELSNSLSGCLSGICEWAEWFCEWVESGFVSSWVKWVWAQESASSGLSCDRLRGESAHHTSHTVQCNAHIVHPCNTVIGTPTHCNVYTACQPVHRSIEFSTLYNQMWTSVFTTVLKNFAWHSVPYEHVLVLWLSTNQDTGVQTTQKICKGTKFLKSYSVFCKRLLLRQSVQKAQNSANCSVLQTQCPVQCTDNVRYTELSTHIAQPFMHTVECTQSTHCSENA